MTRRFPFPCPAGRSAPTATEENAVGPPRHERDSGRESTRFSGGSTPATTSRLAQRRAGSHSRSSLFLGVALVGVVLLSAAPGAGSTLVLDGGTVHPVTAEPFVGRVVVEDGRIAALGADVAVPDGADVVDVEGLHVYPGLVDSFSQLGLLEISSVEATDDRSEQGMANPHLLAASAIHPASEVIPVTRANGVTHSIVAPRPDGDGLIGGQAGLFHLDGWTVEEMAIDPSVAMVVDWPEIQTRRFDFSTFSFVESTYSDEKEKAEERVEQLRSWIEATRHYARAKDSGSERLETDLKLQAMARVLDGNLPLLVLADDRRSIEEVVGFAEEEGLRIVLAGGSEAHEVADLLAEKEIPVVLGLTQSLPGDDDDAYDLPFRNAGVLAGAGVKIAFASGAGGGFGPGGPHGSRTVPYEAASAIPFGLAEDDALRALTIWPAEIFGVADRVGSIEEGKIANLIVTDGDPLDIRTRVVRLLIDGEQVGLSNRHLELYERYRAR